MNEKNKIELAEEKINLLQLEVERLGGIKEAHLRAEELVRNSGILHATLNAILRLSLEEVPLEELITRALKLILEIPQLSLEQQGAIFLVNDLDPERLELAVQVGLPEQLLLFCKQVPFGKCICGRAALEQKIQFYQKITKEHETSYPGIKPHGHYCVPIVFARRTLGVINLYVKEGALENKITEGFLSAVANILAGILRHQRTEEKIHLAAEEWRRTFDALTDIIFTQDTNHVILKANKAMSRMLKLELKDIIGKKCYEVLHKLSQPWPDCPLKKLKQDLLTYTQEINDPNIGVSLLVTVSPMFNKNGELIGAVHIAKDISEIKKRIDDLERFKRVTVDRELKMKELKERIKLLERELSILKDSQ